MTAFFVVVIGIGWIFSQIYQNPGILYIFILISILTNVFSYWRADKIILSMYRAQPATNDSHPDLWNIVENLSITAGLPMPKLYVIPENQPNAFATGRDKEHAAVAVTSGLLQILNRAELEGVIAHELSHIGNRDILLSTVIVVLVGFVSLISDFAWRSRVLGMRGGDRNSRLGGVMAIIDLALVIFAPVVALIIQLAISRKREFLADASGALLTRYPEGLASALEKIAGSSSQPMLRANNATAHLFISNPFGAADTVKTAGTAGGRGRLLGKLFMTHPPAEERIKILRGM
ncbi:MAG: M48 family metalloprotease [Patescibacteria group bacterium]